MANENGATTVLVVEDEDNIRALNTALLVQAGYSVTDARDGRQALDRLRAAPPDVMVLDLSMPHLDGFGVLEAMADLPARPRTVVVTARHDAADLERAIALGASDYLAKPFEPAHLLARVARLARRRGA